MINFFKKLESSLIDNWRIELKRLWSIRIALFWGATSGLIAVWSSFSTIIPLWLFASLSVIMSASMAGARMLKQPGTDS